MANIDWLQEIERATFRVKHLKDKNSPAEVIADAESYVKELYELKAMDEEALRLEAAYVPNRTKVTDRELKVAATLALLRLYEAKVRIRRKEVTALLSESQSEEEQMETMQLINALQQAEKQIKTKITDEQKQAQKEQ